MAQQAATRRDGKGEFGEGGVAARDHKADAVDAGHAGDLHHGCPARLGIRKQRPRVARQASAPGENPAAPELGPGPGCPDQ